MKDLMQVNRSINNVMNKYITENNYKDNVLFESKVMLHSGSIMFTMMMKQGLFKIEPFKAVFPASFLIACEEDQAVAMICNMFKSAIEQCTEMDEKDQLNFSMKFNN